MRVCVPLIDRSVEAMVESAKSLKADLVELRLDYLEDTGGLDRLSKIKTPKIVTCMPKWEGGKFQGSEEDRVALLKRTLNFADYVTVELKTESALRDSLIKEAKKSKVKVIIAFHDFKRTPGETEIRATLEEEVKAGADIAKVAYMPANYGDVLRVMQVLVDKPVKIPIIALSMGELGSISRIMGPVMGAYLTFASASKGRESAAGQLTIDEIRRMAGIIK
ncbi:MAG: type I 3-dehydroquinate dehydratase [Candidatus Altiarchaeota archaeon]